ncbi:MAG: dihydrofolate reductase [Oscillospiraceae bacterium]|nr:dihydrofolate reductase [Oscillospiraceae bacterium]
MNLIAAADSSWGIGLDGNLLYNIPADKSFFRSKTIGKTVVMGRRTYESLPSGSLPERRNIVLTRNPEYKGDENACICHSTKEILTILSRIPDDDIFIIGGEQVYSIFQSQCTHAFITKILTSSPADRHLINFDLSRDWTCISVSEVMHYGDIPFCFAEYYRIKKQQENH